MIDCIMTVGTYSVPGGAGCGFIPLSVPRNMVMVVRMGGNKKSILDNSKNVNLNRLFSMN